MFFIAVFIRIWPWCMDKGVLEVLLLRMKSQVIMRLFSSAGLTNSACPWAQPIPLVQPAPPVQSQQAIQHLANDQANPNSIPTQNPPTVEPLLDEPTQGVTSINVDNLSIAWRPASLAKKLTAFMTRREVEAIFLREKERATNSLNLKPLFDWHSC